MIFGKSKFMIQTLKNAEFFHSIKDQYELVLWLNGIDGIYMICYKETAEEEMERRPRGLSCNVSFHVLATFSKGLSDS